MIRPSRDRAWQLSGNLLGENATLANGQSDQHIGILDGWRALSIVCVLAGHLLPLGPGRWGLNGAVAATGMVIFFNLSGFLIARMLLRDPHVASFVIRRLFRIIPLAWASIAVLATWSGASLTTILANIGFVANLPPTWLMHGGEHLWSLCIEVQFYAGVALLVAVAGRRGLYLLPLAGLTITILRVVQDAPLSIFTWQRIDEILAGCTVAILQQRGLLHRWIPRRFALWAVPMIPLIVLSAHPASGALNFVRPWLSASVIAMSLVTAPVLVDRVFRSRAVVYIAHISYALYVVHGMLMATWLFTGDTVVKYLKRPVLIALAFAFAHVSTFMFEARMIKVGRRLADRMRGRPSAPVAKRAAS
jgi:peptidoglycan/LPS O-acetylase OafA/YrhL